MDRYFEPGDWIRTTDRHECQDFKMSKRSERHESELDDRPDLERLELSVSAVVSAWGIYIVMVVGLLLFSVLSV